MPTGNGKGSRDVAACFFGGLGWGRDQHKQEILDNLMKPPNQKHALKRPLVAHLGSGDSPAAAMSGTRIVAQWEMQLDCDTDTWRNEAQKGPHPDQFPQATKTHF